MVRSVNRHDSELFPHSLNALMDSMDVLGIDCKNSFLTLDAGLDSFHNKWLIEHYGLIPVIKPNRRGITNPDMLHAKFEEFDCVRDIYQKRFAVERTFAWQDTYRKLVIRYEKLQCTHLGFKYLAYSMINFRVLFNGLRRYSL